MINITEQEARQIFKEQEEEENTQTKREEVEREKIALQREKIALQREELERKKQHQQNQSTHTNGGIITVASFLVMGVSLAITSIFFIILMLKY